MSPLVDRDRVNQTGMSLVLIVISGLSTTGGSPGQTADYGVVWNKGQLQFHRPDTAAANLSNEELQRRRTLVQQVFKMREELPPLDMTTAELVRLAREERNWFYER